MPEIINIPSSLYSHRPVSELLHIYATTYGSIVNHPPSIHVPILFCVCISTVGLFFLLGGGGASSGNNRRGPIFLLHATPTTILHMQCSYKTLHILYMQLSAFFVLCIVTVCSLYWTQFILIFIYILNMCQNALILRWIIFQPIPYTCTCS